MTVPLSVYPVKCARCCSLWDSHSNQFGDNYDSEHDTGIRGRSPKMKRIHAVSFAFLLTFAAAPCSAQKAQAPLSAAAAQSKKQNEMPLFTHAEMVQFVHTLQTQAAGWKDAINSVQPSALHIYGEAATIIEQQKSLPLDYLNDIGELDLPSNEINKAVDLGVEFQAFNYLGEIGDNLSQLGDTLSSYASGQIDAAELLQIKKEVNAAKVALYGEILSRILSIARSEESGATLASAQGSDDKKGTQARAKTPIIPLDVRADSWNGAKWMKLPSVEKASYVAGVMDGFTLSPVLFRPSPSLPPALFNADGKTPTTLEIANGLDVLYSKPENLALCMDHAVLIEWMDLAGHRMPASSIEKMRELSGQTGCRLNSANTP